MSQSIENLTVVILSYNRLTDLKESLNLISKLSERHKFRVVVVDNNSDDGSKEWLLESQEKNKLFTLVLNDSNLGVAGGRNSAIPFIKEGCEYVLRIDDDAHIEEEEILALYDYISSSPTVGAATPLVVHAETGRAQNYNGSTICSVSNYHGACHILRKSLIDQIGEIDPECRFGGEELDYSIKIRSLGYDVAYNPNVVVKHNNFPRKGIEGIDRKRMRVYNSARMAFKFWPFGMALLYSLRILASHLFSALKSYPARVFFLHFFDYGKGAWSGMQNRYNLSQEVIEFYRLKTVRPEVGNVPFLHKLRSKLNFLIF